MTPKPLATLLLIGCCASAQVESDKTSELQSFPKNLARHHIGTKLFRFDPETKTYVPAESPAAWLDDDVTTGAPLLSGKQYYLLALPRPELLRDFMISSLPSEGMVTLFASDEPAPPGSKTWNPVARNVALGTINERKTGKQFNRLAKYLLIEADVDEPGTVFSFHLYGDKPAATYSLQKLPQSVDTETAYGEFVNDPTAVNVAGLYAGSIVSGTNSDTGFKSLQKAIDDNPESSLALPPSAEDPSAVVRLNEARSIRRLAILTEPGARGRLDFYFVSAPSADGSQQPKREEASAVSMSWDGTVARQAIEFPEVDSTEILVRWIPENSTDTFSLRELNAFTEPMLSNYAVNMAPEAIAEYAENERASDESKDGKTFKESAALVDAGVVGPEPVGQFVPRSSSYLPGGFGFPSNISTGGPVVIRPDVVRDDDNDDDDDDGTPPVLPPGQPPVLPPTEPVSP